MSRHVIMFSDGIKLPGILGIHIAVTHNGVPWYPGSGWSLPQIRGERLDASLAPYWSLALQRVGSPKNVGEWSRFGRVLGEFE